MRTCFYKKNIRLLYYDLLANLFISYNLTLLYSVSLIYWCLQNNPPENNVEDLAGTRSTLFSGELFWDRFLLDLWSWVPAKSSTLFSGGLFWDRFLLDLRNFFGARVRYKLMYYYFYHGSNLCEIMWNQFPPNLSCLQNNPPENNVEDLVGTRSTLFSGRLFWDWFLLDLRNIFGARFRYKLMYYYFYHGPDLCKIIRFLCKIECIEFECNEFVLVLVQNDLIHFEHSICISSTWTKDRKKSYYVSLFGSVGK